MATPISDDERNHIIDLINQGLTRNQIAETSGRGQATITRIAASIGHNFLAAADQRTQTSLTRAHEARSAYSAERRALIAARLTVEAERLLDQLHEEHLAFNFGGKDNTYEEHRLVEPPVDAKRQLVQAAREAMRTVLDIDRHDNRQEEGLAAVDEWLRGMVTDVVST